MIPNCKKNGREQDIPDDSIKPLTEKDIRRLLLISVRVQNDENLECDWSTFDFKPEDIRKVYESLVYRKYIRYIKNTPTERIPYELKFTQKGMDLIDKISSKESKDYAKLIESVVSMLGTIIPLLSK